MTFAGRMTPLISVAAATLGAVLLAACGGGSSTSSTPSKTSGTTTATVDVATNSSLGNILVDSRGRTLYLFKSDTGTKSTCFGSCATNWPPLRSSGKLTTGTGVSASSVATIARSDG